MKKVVYAGMFLLSLASICVAQRPVMKSGNDKVALVLDGRQADYWIVSPQIDPDVLETPAREVVFVSDIDTMALTLDEWETADFDILITGGDRSHVQVRRLAANPFENPDPRLLDIAPSGKLSREQARFDIDALVYTLSQVHPDIFSVCSQTELFTAVNEAKASLPDSVTRLELYRRAAPIVAMIGDGHTNLVYPYNDVFTKEHRRLPLSTQVRSDKSIVCDRCIDSIIPREAKVLSINGIETCKMLDAMMPFEAGEREHFKLSCINGDFEALRHMLYPSDSFDITYLPVGAKKPLSVKLPAETFEEIQKRIPAKVGVSPSAPYSFAIDKENDVAIMDFRHFEDIEGMRVFADSMFTTLRKDGIGNLIIDVRRNGGGNSRVGDILLRYISPIPFTQMDRSLIRITPTTQRLRGNNDVPAQFTFYDIDEGHYIKPLTTDEGHYDGNVYLLTSNRTFSSAGSFSWTFKETGAGTVVGEETGGMNVCFGDILGYSLPISDLYCTISYKRFWQFRADENDIHGTLPDIAVPADKAMDEVMKLVKKHKHK